MKKLTIGIPTYKRPIIVSSLISDLIKYKIIDYVDILVIDDGPSDELTVLLEPFEKKIRLITHSENRGYAKTYCELFENCKTDYLLITSDDDYVLMDGIIELVNYIDKNSPAFLSTRWLKNGRTHRGKHIIGDITLSQVGQASNHAPGLVYNTKVVTPHLHFLKHRLQQNCQASFFYPQVVILYLLLLENRMCIWHSSAPIQEGVGSDTNLLDSKGNSYFSISGRWKIYLEFIELFNELEKNELPIYSRNAINSIKHLYSQMAYERIYFTIRKAHKELLPMWIGGSIVSNLKSPISTIRYTLRWLIDRKKYKRILRKNEKLMKNG